MASEVENIDLSSLRINRNGGGNGNGSYRNEKSGAKKALLWGGVAAAVLAGAYFGLMHNSAIEVETAMATVSSPSQANAVLNASGYVVAQRKAAVSSKATGRLEELYVIEGDHVKAGQLLGKIENSDVQAQLSQAQAQLSVAKANLENAQAELDEANTEYNRRKPLAEINSISGAELDAALSRVKKAQAMVNSQNAAIRVAEANIRSAQVQLENTYIRAPFEGTVLNKNANVGEVITSLGAAAGARGALVTLADMASLEVEADVSESNIEKISVGQACEISLDAYPEKKYKGIIAKIIPTADRAKATVLTKVSFAERDERVLPEMSAKVLFLAEESKEESTLPTGVVVPASAVLKRAGINKVYVVKEDKVQERVITVGENVGGMISVKNGVTAGEKVVVRPPDNITNGATVSIKE